ncbi:MAG: ABC transporter ATP-binding protein [bacterium]|nr:ABC transporter ATP-binding protein [bacterium]
MQKQEKKSATAGAVFRVYIQHVVKYPWRIFFVFLGAIIVQAGTLAAPLFLREFFNLLASGTPSAAVVNQLFLLLALVGAMYLLEWLGRRIQEISNLYLAALVMADLLGTAFGYLINHSYNFFTSNFAGSLTSKVSRFGRSFEAIFDSILLQFFPTFLFVTGSVVILFLRNHTLGIALGVWVIVFLWFQITVARIRQPIRKARAEADTKITATLADAIGNQNTIALFSGAEGEKVLFKKVIAAWQTITLKLWNADNRIWGGIGLFMIVIEVGLLGGGVFYWQKGLFTIGDFVLIQAYLLTTFDRLVSINRELRRFYDAIADAGEMVAILQMPHEIKDAVDAKPLAVADANISFENITFSFNPDQPILEDFSLAIPGGQKVALVGPSGAGKSTITKLLLRLFDVKGGTVEIDGQNIASVTQNSVRDAIAFVPQEPILFHRTLMENIRYGRRQASDDEVLDAARKAHCDKFISALPEKYNTFVGERGIKLSGGERQRVAIARAILKNSPILVLDEATSSLDSESEALIQDALKTLMEGKTVIVIAHRLSTIMRMDRIVVLQDGVIVADGTHAELLEHKGLYHKLWSIQAGGFLLDDE